MAGVTGFHVQTRNQLKVERRGREMELHIVITYISGVIIVYAFGVLVMALVLLCFRDTLVTRRPWNNCNRIPLLMGLWPVFLVVLVIQLTGICFAQIRRSDDD